MTTELSLLSSLVIFDLSFERCVHWEQWGACGKRGAGPIYSFVFWEQTASSRPRRLSGNLTAGEWTLRTFWLQA